MKTLNILILDDEEKITNRIQNFLESKNYSSFKALTPQKAFGILQSHAIDIVITDVVLPQMDGIAVLKKIKNQYPDTEVILITGHGDMNMVIEAMQGGAVDFIRKPFSFAEIQLAIERTSKYLILQSRLKNMENINSLISKELERSIERDFIGSSNAIKEARNLSLIAGKDKDVNVLITGENGTGKEIIARIIHYSSERKEMPFYPVNSSAIPETLLESEFFGHKKGAFTDAKENKKGVFEMASGGSLFLDEIADMPVSLQAKLLRVLEEKQIRQIGGDHDILIDVRIISATNKIVDKLIDENKFRLDLYHRINTLIINIPPLRERPEDILQLLKYFVNHFAKKKNRPLPKISKGVIHGLKHYSFPGNVRELKNMVERAVILADGGELLLKHFSLSFEKSDVNSEKRENLNLAQNEINLIQKALIQAEYNQNQAAYKLGISRDALIRRLKKYRLKIQKHF